MKITIVSPIFPPEIGGPASYVPSLARRLVQYGEVDVVTFCSQKPHINNKDLYEVHWVPTTGNPLIRQLRLCKTLFNVAKDSDVIYAQGTLTVGLASLVISKLLGKPLVVKFVGDEIWEQARNENKTNQNLEQYYQTNLPSLWMVVHRFILRQSTVITPSQYLKKFLSTTHNVKKGHLKVINNPVSFPKMRDYKKQRVKNQLLYVGRLVHWKRVDLVIRAMEGVESDLIIIGEGPEDKNLKKLAKIIDVNVLFKGKQTKEKVYTSMRESKGLVLMSEYEGQSHVLIEAMSLGVPVIASHIEPNVELLNGYGDLVPLDAKALQDVIRRRITNKHTFKNKPDLSLHTWEIHTSKLIKIFDDLMIRER